MRWILAKALADSALREATEESGIDGLWVLGSGPVDLDAHQLSGAFGSCGEHLDVRFLVVAPAGAEPVVSDESDDVRWFGWDALPRDAVVDLTRLVSAARALFAEVGQPGPSTSGAMSSPAAAATPSR